MSTLMSAKFKMVVEFIAYLDVRVAQFPAGILQISSRLDVNGQQTRVKINSQLELSCIIDIFFISIE